MARHDALRVVGTYGLAHALVDATCASLVFYASATGRIPVSSAAVAVLTYNLLAFASQPLFGWFLTSETPARVWARTGAALTVLAYLASVTSVLFWPAVVLAGLGNAVFHLGGGVISLRIEPGRASLPGFFVAPGAAGLAIGMWLGTNQWVPWIPAVALAVVIPFFRLAPGVEEGERSRARDLGARIPLLAIGTVFVVILLRALVGSGMTFPWKSEPALLWTLTAAVVLGKAAGGALADRFGRASIGVGALVLSAPLLVAGSSQAALGIVGMLFFNMTMPVTLVALADRMPTRPGFAFGLTCLALIAGGLPLALHLIGNLDVMTAGLLVLCSAGLLWVGLTRPGKPSATSAGLGIRSQEVS